MIINIPKKITPAWLHSDTELRMRGVLITWKAGVGR